MRPSDGWDFCEQYLDFGFELAKRGFVVGAACYAVTRVTNPVFGGNVGIIGWALLCAWVYVKAHQMRHVPVNGRHTPFRQWAVNTFAVLGCLIAGAITYVAAVSATPA